MVRAIVIMGILCSLFQVQAEDVKVTGTVKKTGSAIGIQGVKVSFTKIKNLSDTTDANGAFEFNFITSVQSQLSQTTSFQFKLSGNTIIFSPASRDVTGSIDIFSSDGKIKSSSRFTDLQAGKQAVRLPDFSSGVYLMRITVNGNSFTRTLFCLGNDLLLKNEKNGLTTDGNITLAKSMAAVDTLVASKTGYITKKVPIDAYITENIAIEMDTGGGKCSREELQAAVDSYIAALEAADPTKMDLAEGAKYIENMKASSMGEGIWKTKIKVNFHRDFFDVDSCRIFTEIIDNISSEPHEVAAQIKVTEGKISQISALVVGVGDWLLDNAKAFTTRYEKTKAENWSIIPVEKRDTREAIIRGGNAYLDLFAEPYKDTVPWGTPCNRLEGSMYVSPCNSGVPKQNLKMTDRQYIVDMELCTVDIFTKFGGSIPDSHLFRMENGKLRYVHTVTVMK